MISDSQITINAVSSMTYLLLQYVINNDDVDNETMEIELENFIIPLVYSKEDIPYDLKECIVTEIAEGIYLEDYTANELKLKFILAVNQILTPAPPEGFSFFIQCVDEAVKRKKNMKERL